VRKTYDEYYKEDFNRALIDVDYFCSIIETLPEWEFYQLYLSEKGGLNLLNNKNVPWLDIGDLPIEY